MTIMKSLLFKVMLQIDKLDRDGINKE